jgi:nucleotide-binding universal stress UspA family protein
MKTILAPVDFSSVSPRVVAEAAELARAMDGRVVLCSVTEPAVGVVDYAIVVMATAGIDEAAVKRAKERLAAYEAQLTADGVRAESVQLNGSPVPEIVELAEKLPADYIVIGSHGHTALRHLLAGSTASGVLKSAQCPVVILPAVNAEKA